jgi:hypothetical protein
MHTWQRYTIRIDRHGHVTLRTPAGRIAALYGGSASAPDAAAAEWLQVYPGTTLDDRRELPAEH